MCKEPPVTATDIRDYRRWKHVCLNFHEPSVVRRHIRWITEIAAEELQAVLDYEAELMRLFGPVEE